MTRAWPAPDPATTIHFLGDMHFGDLTLTKRDKIAADLARPTVPTPPMHVHVGDLVMDSATHHATAVAWMDALDAPWYSTHGNHDIYNNFQTPAQWAAAVGMPGKNFTVDAGFVKLIFVGCDSLDVDNTVITLSATTRTFLDTELGNTEMDCWIVCHAPLKDTVLGEPGSADSTATSIYFYVRPVTEINAILAAHSNAKAWISGHTHDYVTDTDLIKAHDVGGRNIAAINCSAIHYVGKTYDWNDPTISLYLTKTDTGIDVRFRNHGAGIWDAVAGQRVKSVAA